MIQKNHFGRLLCFTCRHRNKQRSHGNLLLWIHAWIYYNECIQTRTSIHVYMCRYIYIRMFTTPHFNPCMYIWMLSTPCLIVYFYLTHGDQDPDWLIDWLWSLSEGKEEPVTVHKDNPQLVGHPDCTYSGAAHCPIEMAGTGSHPDSTLRDCLPAPFCTSAATFAPPGGTWNQERIIGECQFVRSVYPSFHLSVLWAEVVSHPRCLLVIHTFHFSLL